MANGNFIISLDFELHWGGVELWDLNKKKEYFLNTREAIPRMLQLFEKYEIHVTWATVGFLFAKNLNQLKEFIPKEKPTYENKKLNYYSLFENNMVGSDEQVDPFHFAVSLIDKIIKTPYQELASHTFCHYYCNEKGQNSNQFEADIKAAQKIANKNFGIDLKSLVFPRNQFNKSYLEVAQQNGIQVFRSNPNVWFWQKDFGMLTPIFRALDTLFPISKSLSFFENEIIYENNMVQLPASRFFRPFVKKERIIRKIKLNRIINEMTFAAKNNKIYHLWWHPHNFGDAVNENLEDFEIILKHYIVLKQQYVFESKSMGSFVNSLYFESTIKN